MVEILKTVALIILTFTFEIKQSTQDRKTRVINGFLVKEKQFPFMVVITHLHGTIQCTGSLLTRMKLLTAGHCFMKNSPFNGNYVIAGELDIFSKAVNPNRQQRTITGFIHHPRYILTKHSNDLSIVMVNAPFTITEYVSTIQLAPKNKMLPPSSLAISGGFGAYAFKTPNKPDITQLLRDGKARYAIFKVTANAKIPFAEEFPAYHLEPVQNSQTKIFGDSGGPVINANGSYLLYGATSGGNPYTGESVDVILTLPVNYDWIVQHANDPKFIRSKKNTKNSNFDYTYK